MTNRGDEDLLFDNLARQHAIADDDIVSLALARALARALASDDVDAAAVVSLRALLPPPPPQSTWRHVDVSEWEDHDRQIVRRVLAKYTPGAPPPPPKPARSSRTRAALRLRDVLDRIEARIAASDRPFHNEPTPAECHEAYSALSPMLIDCHITVAGLLHVAGVWPSAEARPVVLPPIEPLALPPPDNIVPLPQRPSEPSPFAGLAAMASAGLGMNALPPGIKSGPEYQ